MAIRFEEIKKYLARNVRLSICFEDGHYHNYLMVSDIPAHKYDHLYVYGVGMIDVEFPRDIYTNPQELEGVITSSIRDDVFLPAIEIVLYQESREAERSVEACLLFKDVKPYLQIGRNFTLQNRKNWSHEEFEYKSEIPEKYDHMYVYGIGMEAVEDELTKEIKFDTYLKNRMVLALSDEPRADIAGEHKLYGKGPFFLVVMADEWNHDADEWLGIYTDKKAAREAYDRAVSWFGEERAAGRYCLAQRIAMFEYSAKEDRFREVEREELT